MNKIQVPFGAMNPLQQRVTEKFRMGKRFVAMISGRQGGKSWYGARWLLSQVASGTGTTKLSLVVAPTYRMARVAQRKLEEVLKADVRLWRSIKHLKQPIPTYEFPDGNIIEVHSSDDPDSLRGLTVDFVWFDESAKASVEAFNILVPTLLATEGLLLMTTTPRGKQNWMYSHVYLKGLAEDDPEYDAEVFHPAYATVIGSTWENVEHLSEEAVKQLENQYGAGSRFAKQEIEGEFVSYEGLVFQWDEVNFLPRDAMPKVEEFTEIIGGLDFGWTDPMAAVVLGYKDGVWYALDGLYESELGLDPLAEQLRVMEAQWGVQRWYADSADPISINDLQQRGIPVSPVKKPKLDDSIRMMSMFTNTNKFKVSYSVPWLRDELQTYQYKEYNPRGEMVPLDRNNHMVDACLTGDTLVATRTGQKRIDSIEAGEEVWTRYGLRRVLLAGLTGKQQPVYEIALSNGRKLVGTYQHPVFVEEKQKFVSIGELSIGDTLTPLHPVTETTFVPRVMAETWASITCTAKSIWTSLGRFQKGTTFTTSTETPGTTHPATLKFSPAVSTWPTTVPSLPTRSVRHEQTGQTRFVTSLRHGTEVTRGKHGIALMRRLITLVTSARNALASSVVSSIRPRTPQVSSAPTSVRRQRGVLVALTTLLARVRGAVRSLRLTSIQPSRTVRVVAPPKLVGNADVYNLTVEDAPEFFANGVLVHNCRYALHMVRHLWLNPGKYRHRIPTPEEEHAMDSGWITGDEVFSRRRERDLYTITDPAGLWSR